MLQRRTSWLRRLSRSSPLLTQQPSLRYQDKKGGVVVMISEGNGTRCHTQRAVATSLPANLSLKPNTTKHWHRGLSTASSLASPCLFYVSFLWRFASAPHFSLVYSSLRRLCLTLSRHCGTSGSLFFVFRAPSELLGDSWAHVGCMSAHTLLGLSASLLCNKSSCGWHEASSDSIAALDLRLLSSDTARRRRTRRRRGRWREARLLLHSCSCGQGWYCFAEEHRAGFRISPRGGTAQREIIFKAHHCAENKPAKNRVWLN